MPTETVERMSPEALVDDIYGLFVDIQQEVDRYAEGVGCNEPGDWSPDAMAHKECLAYLQLAEAAAARMFTAAQGR